MHHYTVRRNPLNMPFGLTAYLNLMLVLAGVTMPLSSIADVVKPALTEISLFADGVIRVEIRTSLEALLTGINGQYRNTRDAPGAEQYDVYRKQSAAQLALSFKSFEQQFTDAVRLTVDKHRLKLEIQSIEIPEPGYTKIPRTSTIMLGGSVTGDANHLQWYYPAKFGEHAVRVKLSDEARQYWHWSDYQWIRQDRVSEPFPVTGFLGQTSWMVVLKTYVQAGFLHILPLGMDHILFILGLFLMSRRLNPLVWQVTMFTLAHSITLSLSTLGLLELPASIVEPLIALSIAYIAVENICFKRMSKARLWVVFGFGLLHGLGFAAMLLEFGMPDDAYLLALLGFNIGVEAGQIVVLLVAWLGLGVWFRQWAGYRRWVVIPGSAVIAAVGIFWLWQRLPLEGI
ncbi:MAG: HupE/UreJ family protein [Gammaproteobacteria bacterium]|nr:HupE/UreJ family protein [Gammaproteobacteria bacterium]